MLGQRPLLELIPVAPASPSAIPVASAFAAEHADVKRDFIGETSNLLISMMDVRDGLSL